MERRKALRICVRRKWRKSPAFGVAPGGKHSPLGCGRAGGVGVAQSTQEGTEGFESLRRREDIEELKEQKKKRKWKRGRVLQVNLIILVLGSLFVPLTNSYICNLRSVEKPCVQVICVLLQFILLLSNNDKNSLNQVWMTSMKEKIKHLVGKYLPHLSREWRKCWWAADGELNWHTRNFYKWFSHAPLTLLLRLQLYPSCACKIS